MSQILSGLFQTDKSCYLAANEKADGKPLVTQLMDAQGNPKLDANKRPIGSIRIEQSANIVNGTYMNVQKRVAFVAAAYDDLVNLVSKKNLADGSKIGGQIIVEESITPFYPTQKAKVNPSTDAPVGFTVNGTFYPVFYRASYTEDMSRKDRLIRDQQTAESAVIALQAQMALQAQKESEQAGVPTT